MGSKDVVLHIPPIRPSDTMLDGHFDWYKNLFLYYCLRFGPMRSHILEFTI